jgi:hypothetical protein
MTTTLRNTVLAAATVGSLSLALPQSAYAVPVQGQFFDDTRCDPVPNTLLSHELGRNTFFPANEGFTDFINPIQVTVCVPNDGIANDFSVQITNTSGIAWQDMHFVANPGYSVGNSDGMAVNFANAAVPVDAFRIDNLGANNSLVENFAPDNIFAPGETWRFLVSNFMHSSGVILPPYFITPGLFAGTGPSTIDTASILANPVPEPTALGVLAVAGAGVLMRRRRRA